MDGMSVHGVVSLAERVTMDNHDNADIYQLGQGRPEVTCPILDHNNKTKTLAFLWAQTWAVQSGNPVTIYRNGTKLIELPATTASK